MALRQEFPDIASTDDGVPVGGIWWSLGRQIVKVKKRSKNLPLSTLKSRSGTFTK